MPSYDDPTVLYDGPTLYDGPAGPAAGHFSPPCDDIVPPIYVTLDGQDPWYPVHPAMQRLFRHYSNRRRGRNIFAMSDGTFRDSQVDGTPPNMIIPPDAPYATAYFEQGGAMVKQDFFQVPFVKRTYYGGSANAVTAAEAAALEAAGYVVGP